MMVLATFVALLGACALVSGSTVPVLLWGNFDHYTPVTAVRECTLEQFSNILQTYQTAETTKTIVFVEDTLSSEDLSKYRASFPSLRNTNSKLYLPNVDSPLAAIEKQADASASALYITADEAIAQASLPTADSSYIIVSLPAAAVGESRAEQLARHDAQMSVIRAKFSVDGVSATTLFVYTGRQSVPVVVKSRHVRQAVAPAPAKNYTFFNDERLMIYYTNLSFTSNVLPIASLSTTLVNATEISVRLHGEIPADDLTFDVSLNGQDWWSVRNIVFRGKVQHVRDYQIGALPNFSFHCTPELLFSTIEPDHKVILSPLRWAGLQLEPNFAAAGPELKMRSNFSDSWDCVSFVSPGMLGGFFVTLLMLIIVSIGITWIMDIRTMDRFDDPKGKAIVLATSSD